MPTDLERFTSRLIAVLRSKDPAGVHTPVAIGDLRQVVMPYRQNRAALGLTSAEDYDLLVLRLIAEEEGLVRTFPAEAADRARDEVASANPDLELAEALAEVTIQIGAATVARLEELPPEPERAGAGRPEPSPETIPVETPAPRPVVDEEPLVLAPVAPAESPLPADLPVFDAIEVPDLPPAPEEPPLVSAASIRDRVEVPACPSCSRPLPTHRAVTYCPYCGWQVAARRCRRCGEVVEADWRHCIACGLAADGPPALA